VVIGDAASKGSRPPRRRSTLRRAADGVEFQTKLSTLIHASMRSVNRSFSAEHFVSMVYAELSNSSNGLVSTSTPATAPGAAPCGQ